MSSNINIKEFDLLSNKVEDISFDNFGLGDFSENIVSFSLRNQLSSYRSSHAKVKAMSEISGTTAKPFKQKGTGRARQGSKRAVQMRGGRCCFGPTGKENHNKKTIKKIANKSISIILSNKLNEGSLYSLKNLSALKKTTDVSNFLKNNNLKKPLFILDKSSNQDASKFCSLVKNIPNSEVVDFRSINPYLLLNFDNVVADSSTLEKIVKKYKR